MVRDLHDGAQGLVHTIITLKLACQALEREETVPRWFRKRSTTRRARRSGCASSPTASFHRPDEGRAARGRHRAGVADARAVKIDVSVDRLPPAVEATAYFVAEALTNVAKHASAGHAEVAEMLDTGETAVKGALQRARATLRARLPSADRERAPQPKSASERRLVGRFADAVQSGDLDAMVTLLTDDALLTMPPQPLEYQGHDAIAAFMRHRAQLRGAPLRFVADPRQHPTGVRLLPPARAHCARPPLRTVRADARGRRDRGDHLVHRHRRFPRSVSRDRAEPLRPGSAPDPAEPSRGVLYARPVMTAALRERAVSIGADPRDTVDERFRKRLLVAVALIILPIGFLWGCLYWAFGEEPVALTPWGYVAGSALSLAVFARTRSFASLRTSQLLLILVAPALGTGDARRPSRVQRGDPLVAARAARGGRAGPSRPGLALVRGLRRHAPARAGPGRGRPPRWR